MRLKKGFTLAEILIVLMVIGVVATMTIPSLMKGVQDAQFKTAYKKAFNAVVNIAAMENVSGNLPASNDSKAVEALYKTLRANLSIKDYAEYSAEKNTNLTSGVKIDLNDLSETPIDFTTDATNSPWFTTDDNISYIVMTPGQFITESGTQGAQAATSCGTKADINSDIGKACAVIVVDVNGITGTPNKMEPQATKYGTVDGALDHDKQIDGLTNDRLPIFIGTDGATAGSKKTTVTGRIVAELK